MQRWLWGAAGLGLGLALVKRRQRYELHGKRVLITGGSRGLGRALAEEFTRRGARIVICARDERQLAETEEALWQAGADVTAIPCDVGDRGQVREMMAKAGEIDVLVANAGEIVVAPLEHLDVEDFQRAMDIMFWGVVYPALEVLPSMRARGGGRIAAITSIGGKVAVPHLLAYTCAKFAAVGFCEGLRAEVARHGIAVTTIAPGLMRTGSHVRARFKGRVKSEAAWFGFGATSRLTSMSVERAASQIVDAIERGDAEKVLTTQASLLARVNGAFPGLVPDTMRLVNRLLPAP